MADTPEYPGPGFGIAFADGAMAITNSPTIVKFFMYRFEPNFAGDGRTQPQPFAQVVMPMDGFAGMAVFFDIALRHFIANNLVDPQKVDEMRAALQRQTAEPQT